MSPVHPRARGEHNERMRMMLIIRGSSPRSRGTFDLGKLSLTKWRFIPALAGNIKRRPSSVLPKTVHPRARGEHWRYEGNSGSLTGSSPRSRGTFSNTIPRCRCCRFIPALAGNILFRDWLYTKRPVHPRARGEHKKRPNRVNGYGGSSPRSRGTYNSQSQSYPHPRFIPALAGNIISVRYFSRFSAVHPRARGEHRPRLGGDSG